MPDPRRIRLIRKGLFIFAFFVALLLAGLYVIGRLARPSDPAGDGGSTLGADTDVRQVGKGFDHTVTQDGRPLFRIRGGTDQRDRAGNVRVEEVGVTLYDEDGDEYRIVADELTYNVDRKIADLTGEVRLESPDRFVLRTDELAIRDNGTVIRSEAPVTFEHDAEPRFGGSASHFRADLDIEHFAFRGNVEVEGSHGVQTPFSLRSAYVLFQRPKRVIRADRDAVLTWGESRLTAERFAVHLASGSSTVRALRARWDVDGDLRTRDEHGIGQRLELGGRDLVLWLAEDGRTLRRLELEGNTARRAELAARDDSGQHRRLEARRVEADLVEGRLGSAVAVGAVQLHEHVGADDEHATLVRSACSERAVARFDGERTLEQLELEGQVELHEDGRQLSASRLVAVPDQGRYTASGEPAALYEERGLLQAPTVEFTETTGIARAAGGVEAELDRGSEGTLGVTLLAGPEPIRVTSEEAFWRRSPPSFLFRGKARAWSGENYITASQLRGDPDGEELSAAGGVETVWFRERDDASFEGASPRETGNHPIRVRSETMIYDADPGVLTYRDNVLVTEGARSMTCARLVVELDDEGEVERLVCFDDVVVETGEEGQVVRAARAEYELADGEIVFFGEPVEVEDAEGKAFQGRRVIYEVEAGAVRVLGETGGDSG